MTAGDDSVNNADQVGASNAVMEVDGSEDQPDDWLLLPMVSDGEWDADRGGRRKWKVAAPGIEIGNLLELRISTDYADPQAVKREVESFIRKTGRI